MANTMKTGRIHGRFSNNSRRFAPATEKVKTPMAGIMAKESVAKAAGIIQETDAISYDESDLKLQDSEPAVEAAPVVKEAESIPDEKKTEDVPSEEGAPNICTFCSAEYKTSRGLASHVESKHSEAPAEVGSN